MTTQKVGHVDAQFVERSKGYFMFEFQLVFLFSRHTKRKKFIIITETAQQLPLGEENEQLAILNWDPKGLR